MTNYPLGLLCSSICSEKIYRQRQSNSDSRSIEGFGTPTREWRWQEKWNQGREPQSTNHNSSRIMYRHYSTWHFVFGSTINSRRSKYNVNSKLQPYERILLENPRSGTTMAIYFTVHKCCWQQWHSILKMSPKVIPRLLYSLTEKYNSWFIQELPELGSLKWFWESRCESATMKVLD